MKTPYRILKLRSGEQLIARLKGENDGKIIVERPMVFMTRVIMDPYSGRQRELTVLKNWLSHTNEIETLIPKDYVATYLVPNTDVLELYSLEKEKEDTNPPAPEILNTSQSLESPEDLNEDAMQNLVDAMKDVIEENPDFVDEMKEMQERGTKNFITMSMMLPPEALLTLVEAGLLDEEDILNLIDNVNGWTDNDSRRDSKRKDSKDFGNNWKDWSPDLRDYLE